MLYPTPLLMLGVGEEGGSGTAGAVTSAQPKLAQIFFKWNGRVANVHPARGAVPQCVEIDGMRKKMQTIPKLTAKFRKGPPKGDWVSSTAPISGLHPAGPALAPCTPFLHKTRISALLARSSPQPWESNLETKMAAPEPKRPEMSVVEEDEFEEFEVEGEAPDSWSGAARRRRAATLDVIKSRPSLRTLI